MAVNQTLTVNEVTGSANVDTNQSKVRVLWVSEQTGASYNEYTRTAYYWVSINGGPETQYSVSYTLPLSTKKTIVDTTITIPHNDDGSATVKVRTWMDARIALGEYELEETVNLTPIARASKISSAADVTLGNRCSVKWTPKAASFRYKLEFVLEGWNYWIYTTGIIHPNTTSEFTYTGCVIPLDVAKHFTSGKTATMKVYLYTYSNSGATAHLGSADAKTFTVTVPDNINTKPAVSMELSAVHNLPEQFNGLYIQGKSRVKGELSAQGKYGASILSQSIKIGNETYDSDDAYTSEWLNNSGKLTVYGYAEDSRGFTGSVSTSITVIPYSKPKILDVEVVRCDDNGNEVDEGTNLKISATRSYSPVKTSTGVKTNFCEIRYRYKLSSAPDSEYSEWTTLLPKKTPDDHAVGALLGGLISAESSYTIEVQAIDDVGESTPTFVTVPTAAVYMHKTKNAMGLGKYAEGENLLDVAWDAHFHGDILIGSAGMTLKDYILSVMNGGE